MSFKKDEFKPAAVSVAGLMFFLLVQMPIMFVLLFIMGSTPLVLVLPAIVSYVVLFCVEGSLVADHKINKKQFFIFVYIVPEAIMMAAGFIMKNLLGTSGALGDIFLFCSYITAISIVLRGLAEASSFIFAKSSKGRS